MSDFPLRVFDRAWEPLNLLAGVEFAPDTWDAQAIGGGDTAEIRLQDASLEDLVGALHWLGYNAIIMSPDDEYVWAGDIEEIVFVDNGVTVGVTLNGVVNAIKVLYTVFDPGGEASAGETDRVYDNESISLYGRRERQHSAETPMRKPQAEKLRDTLLKNLSRPFALPAETTAGNETYAVLRCKGFWHRLRRVYYKNIEGLTEYTEGALAYPLGMGFTSSFVAAVNVDGRFHFHQIFGRLEGFAIAGLQFKVSGMSSGTNNGAFTVESGDAKEAKSYSANNIKFDPADDIQEAVPYAYQLIHFEVDDVIQVSGAANPANNGSHLVKTTTSTHLEVSPSWSNPILAGAAGPSITVQRGNKVTVEQATANERTGASATVTAYGQRIAQSFVTGTAANWDADSVEVRIRKVGAPTDDVEVRLCTDTAGSPGTWVATATIDDTAISGDDGGSWVSAAFDIKYTLVPATLYWLVVQRAGANESDNYYHVYMDEAAGYAGGTLKLHDGSAFQTPAVAKSMLFRVLGAVDTADQVKAICDSMGVFSGVVVEAPSGIKTNQYRDGSQFAADEVAALLDTGDSSNVRLIATVGTQRNVTIRPQPAKSTAMHLWKGSDNLCNLQGNRETLGLLPVGAYCGIDNPLLLQGPLEQASPFFIEYARYAVDSGWGLRASGPPDPWAIGEVKNE